MDWKACLFPEELRFLPGQRWLNVLFRTFHLVGLAGLGAGFLYPGVDESWRLYLTLTLATGVGLTLISIYSSAIWLIQLRGICVFIKVGLLALIYWLPEYKSLLFILVIVLSGWIAHAPASVRYYSIFHGRRVGSLH